MKVKGKPVQRWERHQTLAKPGSSVAVGTVEVAVNR
jgi:hypothetical protein